MNSIQWVSSLFIALMLHLLLAAGIFHLEQPEAGVAVEAGEGGVDVGLGMLGSYEEVLQPPEPEKEPEPAPVEPPKPEKKPQPKLKPQPPEPVVKPKLPESEPEPKPEPQPQVTTVKTAEVSQIAVAKVEAKAETAVVDEPAPQVEKKPEPKPASVRATGRHNHASAGATAGNAKTYFSALMAWLNRFKDYPAALKKEKIQGVVTVEFTIAKNGDITKAAIKKSSGHPELDAAAMSMLQNASPVPPIPESMNRETIKLVIPVEYSLITNRKFTE
ncbi:energy transducer TonB [Microbulbifer aggregans]|uniref:energy transducer TonB n=1 Tax=Microbulbifer aggregans TaxID=1769779 RepID=UPI001CFE0773|nr:energy transducer TonB [Microbulbifer aggregans]